MNINNYEESCNIRKSYEILPFQGVWTWLTGKEINGRKLLWKPTSIEGIIWANVWVIIGLALSIYAFNNFETSYFVSSFIYLIGIIFSASGARYIVATIIHHGVHGHLFTKKTSWNRILCEILSTIFIIQPYDSYKKFHVYEHHGKDFSTLQDKDLSAIYQLGFKPGTDKNKLYLNLLLVIINPKIHLDFFIGRLKSNIINVPTYRTIMSVCWFIFLSYIIFSKGIIYTTFILVIPFIFLYQICSILHLVTEHIWLLRNLDEPVKKSHYNNCLSRFCGERCPESFGIKNSFAWLKWSFNHLFFHLPVRMLIVQGSLVCHDWHHRFGGEKRWFLYSQLREINAKKLNDAKEFNYVEIWGFQNSLSYVFDNLSEAELEEGNEANDYKYRLN